MNPYAHLVIAQKVAHLFNPANPSDYYWGAVIPDIRYLTAIKRDQTHIPTQQIAKMIAAYPHLESFLQGYLVHCLVDQIDLGELFSHFPLSVFKGRFSRQQIAVMLELYYFEHEKISLPVSGKCNQVLSGLGVTDADCAKFSQFIYQYVHAASPETQISSLLKLVGLEGDSRVEKYISAAKRFQNNRLLKNMIFPGIRAARVNHRIIGKISSQISAIP